MTNKLLQRLASVLFILFISANAHALNHKLPGSNDQELKLNLTVSYTIKVVQVSLDATDGDTGSFQITDKNGTVVKQMEIVELIKSPNYFTIDVNDFPEGDYTFQLIGKTKTFTSSLHIK